MKRSILRILYHGLLLAIMGLVIASCSKYPTYDVNTSDLDMVWTNYDDASDFAQYKTYYVADTLLIDSTATPEEKAEIQEYYESILAEVNANMQALNYVRVDSSADPDIGMGISIVSRATILKELKLKSLTAVNLSPKLERPFSFVRQRYKFKSRAADELLAFAQEFCKKM